MLGHQLSDGHRLRKLGAKELVKIRRVFNELDQDGSGDVDIIEVRAPLANVQSDAAADFQPHVPCLPRFELWLRKSGLKKTVPH